MNLLRPAVGLAIAMSIASLPAGAAAETLVPPGNSALNQYKETLPAPGGNTVGGGDHRSPAQVLGSKNAERLGRLGPEGRAAAELAAATAPARRPGKHGGRTGTGGSGSSGLGEILGQATGASGSGELGLLLPLVVAATILGAVAYAIVRRRTS